MQKKTYIAMMAVFLIAMLALNVEAAAGRATPEPKYKSSWAHIVHSDNANSCFVYQADGITHFKDVKGYYWTNWRGETTCIVPRQRGGANDKNRK